MKSLLKFIAHIGQAKTRPATLIGTLPSRKSSVVALVLAKLLSGQKVNAIDMAAEAQTSRVKDLIASLRRQHAWGSISSDRIAVGTADGRVQWVTQYWLSEEVLALARTLQNLDWVDKVFEARRIQRLNKKSAQWRAKACNSKLVLKKGKSTGSQK